MLEELKNRNLPSFLTEDTTADNWPERRKEIVDLLCREEYGFPPAAPLELKSEYVEDKSVTNFCAGKASYGRYQLSAVLDTGVFTFPMTAVIPTAPGPHPFFVLINFRPDVPDRYLPAEELVDRGYGVLSFYYQDVTPDRADDLKEGLGAFLHDGERPGKIALWAWAASRVLDWAETRPELDVKRSAVIGHSRLGKTALLCGALDERFAAAISNDSGCCGAAVARDKQGESIEVITRVFPFWFCESFRQYADREHEMPFDQHALIAASAPRYVMVGSAEEDLWADPVSEYLSCAAAGEAWKLLGKKGFVHPDRLPKTGDVFHDGDIGYHLRKGSHYLSREDWNRYMDFLDEKGFQNS